MVRGMRRPTLPIRAFADGMPRGEGLGEAEAGQMGLAPRSRAWQAANAAAIEEYNRRIEASGVPLAGFRKF